LRELGVDCRVVDIANEEAVRTQFDGVDTVFHVAAAYRTEHADRAEFRRVNVEATRVLLETAAEKGVRRFVHCSTVGVQGQIDDPPASETYRTQPGDHYQQTKFEGELLALDFFRTGLPGAVVRPVGIFGPGDTRFLKLFRAIDRGRFVMIGSGETFYHLTYIDDLITGMLLAATHPAAVGEVFTIAGPEYTTIRELVSRMAGVLGRREPRLHVPFAPVYMASVLCERVCTPLGIDPPLYPRRVEFFSKDRAFDISKARDVLGFEPAIELVEGLRLTAEWYRGKGLL
jgi:nucleoside-diphosphate-sugar epimerase